MSRRTAVFAAAVLAQVLILLSVPAPKVWTRLTGEAALLAIAPADPFDPLRGWHLVLRYEIGDVGAFGEAVDGSERGEVWAVLAPDEEGVARPVRLARERPEEIGPGEIVVRGRVRGRRITYGIERFFVPEEHRGRIDRDLREHADEARAEVRVGGDGRLALVALRVQDREY